MSVAAYAQQPLTARSVVAKLDGQKETYEVKDFRIGGKYDLSRPAAWAGGGEGGVTLESLGAKPARTAYMAVGTPKRDAKGEIVNAIVINSYYSGDATAMYNNWYAGMGGNAFSGGALVGPGLLFDTNRFYVIFLDALGLWGASKPSDGLGRKFPVYSYYDMVQLNYRLLRDRLKVGRVVLATGVSMGATQAYYWGLMHPQMVQAVMPIGGATATDGDGPVAAWTFQLAKAALESDPVWVETKGNYYHLPKEKHPNQGMQFMWSTLQLTGLTFPVRSATPWKNIQREVFYWEPKGDETAAWIGRVQSEDAVDYWYRNNGGFGYNINKELKRIKARTLVVHVQNDQWLMVQNARKAAAEVDGALFATLSDPGAHYGVFKAPNVLKDTIGAFIENRFTGKLPGIGGGDDDSSGGPGKPAGLAK
jgi:homoserine acetyltransferase